MNKKSNTKHFQFKKCVCISLCLIFLLLLHLKECFLALIFRRRRRRILNNAWNIEGVSNDSHNHHLWFGLFSYEKYIFILKKCFFLFCANLLFFLLNSLFVYKFMFMFSCKNITINYRSSIGVGWTGWEGWEASSSLIFLSFSRFSSILFF